jgi:ubiquinone/menaquinone biosynthesis C-methylase UbiE
VDIVTVAQAAHWLDLPEFYDEVRRVVRPGGLISLITYDTVEASHPVRPLLAQFYSEVIGPYWPAERKHVETGYRLLAFPFDEIATPAMTMRSSWTFKELIGYIDTWSAIRNCEAIRGRQPIELFFTELEQLWGDMDIRREFSWKLSMRVGRV